MAGRPEDCSLLIPDAIIQHLYQYFSNIYCSSWHAIWININNSLKEMNLCFYAYPPAVPLYITSPFMIPVN